jgi:hypothetical protein
MALWMVDQYQISQTRACKCVLLARSMFFYKHHRRDETALKMRLITNLDYGAVKMDGETVYLDANCQN